MRPTMQYRAWNERGRIGGECIASWLLTVPWTQHVEGMILEHLRWQEGCAWRTPEDHSRRISHETIYQYIYAHPAGELKRILIRALRQGHHKRRPRSRGKDRRGGLRNMRSIRQALSLTILLIRDIYLADNNFVDTRFVNLT